MEAIGQAASSRSLHPASLPKSRLQMKKGALNLASHDIHESSGAYASTLLAHLIRIPRSCWPWHERCDTFLSDSLDSWHLDIGG